MRGMQLYGQNGERKYLAPEGRDDFLKAAEKAPREVRTCGTLAYTGCRINEALALTADRVDLKAGAIIFESWRKGATASMNSCNPKSHVGHYGHIDSNRID